MMCYGSDHRDSRRLFHMQNNKIYYLQYYLNSNDDDPESYSGHLWNGQYIQNKNEWQSPAWWID